MGSLSDILSNIKNGIPTLSNTSVTAIFNKLASALSINIDSTIAELQNTQTVIDQNIATNNYGKAGYYIAAALQYEDGVDMVFDPTTMKYIYSPVDISKQSISQAAFEEETLILKVATTDSSGNLIKLDPAVLSRFIAYMKQSTIPTLSGGKLISLNAGFEIPGIIIYIVSKDPNLFTANFIITYFGSYSLINIQSALIAAIKSFINSFTYDGILYIGDLQDYLKSNVPGIRDVVITNAAINSIGFVGKTNLTAGYFTCDATGIVNSATYNSI